MLMMFIMSRSLRVNYWFVTVDMCVALGNMKPHAKNHQSAVDNEARAERNHGRFAQQSFGMLAAAELISASVSSLRPRQALQEANFPESTKLPRTHKTALNKRAYPDALSNDDEYSPAQPAPALTLDSAKPYCSNRSRRCGRLPAAATRLGDGRVGDT
jgi:hypothetical protein